MDPSVSGQTVMDSTQSETPCACNLHVFDKEEKKRHAELMHKLDEATLGTVELADGFEFRLDPRDVEITDVAEWITYERLCCPFFNFEVELQSGNNALSLRLRGGDKVKEFLRPDVERQAVFEPKF